MDKCYDEGCIYFDKTKKNNCRCTHTLITDCVRFMESKKKTPTETKPGKLSIAGHECKSTKNYNINHKGPDYYRMMLPGKVHTESILLTVEKICDIMKLLNVQFTKTKANEWFFEKHKNSLERIEK